MTDTQDRMPTAAASAEVSRIKQRAAALSVAASVLLTLAKFAAALV